MLNKFFPGITSGWFSWGQPVQNHYFFCGVFREQIEATKQYVHNPEFLHTFLNNFSTRKFTGYFSFSICLQELIHFFHTTYNNHSVFKETNL